MKTMLDSQFERCKAALIRLENLVPEDATGETTVPIAVHEINDLDVFVQNAQFEIASRRAMSNETVRAIRNGNIEMTRDEFIDISQATATLRNALDCMPDNTPARGQVVAANALILETLRAIGKRDGRDI